MLTGIDLSSINATAVLLHMVGTDYRPITLGISERYDEYGCIEGVARDRNIEMVCDFFSAARRAGRFLAEAQTHTGNPEWFDIEIEALLYLVEQATTCAEIFQESQGGWGCPPSTVLGRAHPHPRSARTLKPVMDAAFGAGAGIADEIYGHHLDDVADQLRKLAAISEFINRQPALRWSPPGEPKQRYNSGVGRQFSEEEGLQFVLAARRDHRDEPAIQAALDAYLRSIE